MLLSGALLGPQWAALRLDGGPATNRASHVGAVPNSIVLATWASEPALCPDQSGFQAMRRAKEMATTRRRFTAEFKARVVMEALRGDRTIQEIGAKHHVHPNQVSGWKRQAQDGLRELFADGVSRRQADHEATIHELHAKIGELTVERDFLARGLKL